MNGLLRVLPAAALLGGCVVYDASDDDCCDAPPPPPPPPANYAPFVSDAHAGVYWDNAYRDDIWYFEAVVDDPNGPYDVTSVWADVYDDWNGAYLDSFELYPTSDPYVWYSDWMGHSTYLDPWYDYYGVDIVAYDAYGATDYVTIGAVSY